MRYALSIFGAIVMLFLASGVAQAQDPLDPCLPGDPYELAELAQVIASTTPPSTPVIINPDLTVVFVRSATMDDADEIMGRGDAPAGPGAPDEDPVDEVRLGVMPVRIFNTRTQFEWRVTMSEGMLRAIYDCHAGQGRTDAGGPLDAGVIEGETRLYMPAVIAQATPASVTVAFARLRPAGWSNGDDSRTVRTPTTLWPWRTITQSSSWPNGEQSRCTMTLIGPRHLITAAHCLVDFGTSNWKARKLTPARSGANVEPYGVSQMTPNPPAGSEAWYIVPDPWLDPNTPDDINKYQWDIGLVLMLDRLGDQTGWMGYGAYPAGELNSRYHFNRGYPSCNNTYSERPQNCQIAQLYGDSNECEIGYYHNQGSNGWNREFAFGCDMSRGHSGSALYHYRYSPSKGKVVPVVTAVVSWHECLQCTDDDDFPNHARRITPWVLTLISWLKEQFP
jgi:V8-like Glu-specific endopeptidase